MCMDGHWSMVSQDGAKGEDERKTPMTYSEAQGKRLEKNMLQYYFRQFE